MKLIDITGERFNKLTVKKYNPKTKKWICVCDCGNITEVKSYYLRTGHTKSCGCLQKEKSSTDLTGKKFGYLTVLGDSGERDSHRRILWNCQCICGKIIKVRTDNLTSNNTLSCGCLKQSHGELIIQTILEKKQINYKKEYCCKGLISPKGGMLRFDFAIFDNNNKLLYLIEYDGETHSLEHVGGWNNKEKIEYQLKCDKIKDEFCKEHNINLVRINFTENITEEKIILEGAFEQC